MTLNSDPDPQKLSQAQRLLLLQEEWSRQPEENMSQAWWAEFDQFLRDNPVKFGSPETIEWEEIADK